MDTDKQQFCSEVYPIIKRECTARGYEFPAAVLAHLARESAWGKSKLSAQYHNYGGIKCGISWKGKSVNMKTMEEYNPGTLTQIWDNFRVYDSIELGIIGYFDFLELKRYADVRNATSEKNYFERLKAAGYFTSNSVISTIQPWLDECHEYIDNIEDVSEGYYYSGKLESLDGIITDIARDVIVGNYGNGENRKTNLGRYYDIIQTRVNELLKE